MLQLSLNIYQLNALKKIHSLTQSKNAVWELSEKNKRSLKINSWYLVKTETNFEFSLYTLIW